MHKGRAHQGPQSGELVAATALWLTNPDWRSQDFTMCGIDIGIPKRLLEG